MSAAPTEIHRGGGTAVPSIRDDVTRVIANLLRDTPWRAEGLAELEAAYPELGRDVRRSLETGCVP